jgi:TPR repeat protein
VFFARNAPTTVSCEKAAKTFAVPQLDFKSMASNPGYEQFAEFPLTLARIRNESGFSVPNSIKNDFETASKFQNGISNVASLDAADALKEKGDGSGRGSIYMGMAKRGDAMAAQEVGLTYLNGKQVEKNIPAAYRWFYAAWSLSDMDGLNAMGVMLRDGLGVPVNAMLAQSAFYLAKATAKNKAAFERASKNIDKLAEQISNDEKSKIACMSLKNLDDALRAPIETLQSVVQGKPIINPERRLGSIVKDLTAFYQPDFCK